MTPGNLLGVAESGGPFQHSNTSGKVQGQELYQVILCNKYQERNIQEGS